MAVSFLAASAIAVNSGSTSVVVDKPAGVAVGDVMLTVASWQNTTTLTAPAGWTQIGTTIASVNVGEGSAAVFYRIVTGSEGATFTWTLGSEVGTSIVCVAYTGTHATSPIDVNQQQASTAVTSPTATTTVANAMVVHAHGAFLDTATGSFAAPAGMTERADGATSRVFHVYVADVLQASAGATGTKQATVSGAGVTSAGAWTIGLAPAAAAAAARTHQMVV